jgi:valyl-tRNA synthetase
MCTATENDQSLSYPKLDAARKFTNKLWNMARFIEMKREDPNLKIQAPKTLLILELKNQAVHQTDKEWIEKVEQLSADVTRYLDSYQFNLAVETLYEFIWHQFADVYIEDVKNRIDENSFIILKSLFLNLLKLLHPFMPFVTEELYKQLQLGDKMLIIEDWPQI